MFASDGDEAPEPPLPSEKPARAINRREQAAAFPPNYIHSLDSAHMMMTALKCSSHGVAFAGERDLSGASCYKKSACVAGLLSRVLIIPGVHDSYWTHAGTVDEMSRLLREAFVELHSRPLLKQLEAELKLQLQPTYESAISGGDPSKKKDARQVAEAAGDHKPAEEGLQPIPPTGDLDINVVRDAKYFFS